MSHGRLIEAVVPLTASACAGCLAPSGFFCDHQKYGRAPTPAGSATLRASVAL